jgi:[protein-PII] uridylyltransferase
MNLEVNPAAVLPDKAPDPPPLVLGDDWGKAAREYLDEARSRLFEWHRRGASGTAVVAAYTRVMDDLIRALFEAASDEYAERFSRLDQRCAVVAQGGYGRGELNPCSDIDLLFLYSEKREPYIENVAERILYTLWDTRVTVGNAMRNVRECVRLAGMDFKVKTSLLDARFLCGDEALYGEFAKRMESDVLKRNADRFFREKMAENDERHQRFGDSVYLLEPQLKEGEGGLRDLHTAMWMAKVKFKTNSIAELVQKGVITEREREEIEAARDFLFRVRNSLHFLSKQHQDQLTFQYQEQLAPMLGFEDTATMKGVELFMRTYYLNAATVNRFADEIIERCTPERRSYFPFGRTRARSIRPGVSIVNDALTIAGSELLHEDPSNLLRVFLDAQRHGVGLSNGTKRLLRAHLDLMNDAVRTDPSTIDAFFEILRGKQVYETLREMHRAGVLGAFLPEFGALTCMVLHDLYHIYTVDEHSLRGVHELELLRSGAHKKIAPLLTHVMRDADNVELLMLGMLLHDIGKGRGGGHSERGASMCDAISARLGLNTDDAAQLKFLVAQHLNMSHLAQRRDIHDTRLLIDFAKRVETLDNLKKLYLLTFADMRAVGPKIWNNWHDMLLGELYLRTAEVFDREEFVEEDQRQRAARIRQRIAEEAAAELPAELVSRFLSEMPDRYVLGTPEETILRHLELLRRYEGALFVMETKHHPEREFSELTVLTVDRPGLFARLTGVLHAHGMNILTASIHTSDSGMALDVFRISHGETPEVVMRAERWERIQASLRQVLTGEVEVEQLVASIHSPSLAKRYVPRVPTKVEIDNDVSSHYTVLDVYTHDRVGLLFTIASTLYHLGLSIHIAKITTNVDQVLDVFYVSDAAGQKITDALRLAQIERELMRRLMETSNEAAAPA